MSEKQHIERIYAKVREKNPGVEDPKELQALAIQLDQKETKRNALICLLTGIAFVIVFLLLISNETYAETKAIALIGGVSFIVEGFRTFAKIKKVHARYEIEQALEHKGTLQLSQLIFDCGKQLKKAHNQFRIYKRILLDKDDTDVGYYSISHRYDLRFKLNEGDTVSIKVNRKEFENASMNEEFFLVITGQNKLIAIYSANEWNLGSELEPYFTE